MIVPVQLEYLSLRGLAQLQQTLSQVREHLNPDVDIFGILPTMYDGRTMHCREAVDVLHANFGDTVFRTRIGKTVRFAEAPVQGQSALKFDSGGQSARWYRQVAREVLERDGRWSDDLERMRNTQNAAAADPAPVLRLAS